MGSHVFEQYGKGNGDHAQKCLSRVSRGNGWDMGVRVLITCMKVALWKVCSLLALKGLCFSMVECLQLGIHELELNRGRDGNKRAEGDVRLWQRVEFRGLFQPRVGIG